MELANYNQLAKSVFGTPIPKSTDIAYLENRLANIELVTRRGINVNDMLKKMGGTQGKHHITDVEARAIESELNVEDGWLDDEHQISTRRALCNIRQTNLSKLVLDPQYRDTSTQFLKDILSTKQASQGLYFLMYEVTFEDQSFYLRSIEETLGLPVCYLDKEMN